MKSKILKISIVGRTNAGKSTLINKIIGEKISIQNKKINTTQDMIIGIKNIKNTQILFYDTPGSNFLKNSNIHKKKLKQNLWNGIDESDLILYMIDAYALNMSFLYDQINKIKEVEKTIFIIFNKIDNKNTATHSKLLIKLIRNKIRFKNLLISDDLSMKSLKGTLKDNTIKTFNAGCNLALHCNGNFKEMLIVAKNSPLVDKFIIKKTSQFYKILR